MKCDAHSFIYDIKFLSVTFKFWGYEFHITFITFIPSFVIPPNYCDFLSSFLFVVSTRKS